VRPSGRRPTRAQIAALWTVDIDWPLTSGGRADRFNGLAGDPADVPCRCLVTVADVVSARVRVPRVIGRVGGL
jgi:hypothetical protein